MLCIYRSLLVAAACALLCAPKASAETEWICTIVEGIECGSGEECGPPYFAGVEPPTFFHVDTQKKLITLLAPDSRRGETTEIGQSIETSNGWTLGGVEETRAWSVILTNDGYMTLTVTMDGTTWSAFGWSMPADQAKP